MYLYMNVHYLKKNHVQPFSNFVVLELPISMYCDRPRWSITELMQQFCLVFESFHTFIYWKLRSEWCIGVLCPLSSNNRVGRTRRTWGKRWSYLNMVFLSGSSTDGLYWRRYKGLFYEQCFTQMFRLPFPLFIKYGPCLHTFIVPCTNWSMWWWIPSILWSVVLLSLHI